MFLGIQLLGLLFIAMMIYFTYLNYKRHNYGSRSFVSWTIIWIIAGIVVTMPQTLYGLMNYLNIERTYDLFYVGAFTILFIVVFNMYVTIKKTHTKVEKLVRENALNNPLRKNNKIKKKK